MTKEIVLITGASMGFGYGLADLLVQDGAYEVIITARNQVRLKEAAMELGCDYFVADATSPADWAALRKYIMDKHGRLDILVNNAGGGVTITPLAQQTAEQIRQSLELNLFGCITGCHTFVNDLQEAKKGTIINVTSVCAVKAWPGFSIYSAAKAGMRMFTKCLQTELQKYSIRCTTFVPATGRTNFSVHAGLPENTPQSGLHIEDAGRAMYDIIKLPKHVMVEEYVVWGMDQHVQPM